MCPERELTDALESYVEKRDIHAIEEWVLEFCDSKWCSLMTMTFCRYLSSRMQTLQAELEKKEELDIDELTETIKECTKKRRAHLEAGMSSRR